jgi:hypothetical protein
VMTSPSPYGVLPSIESYQNKNVLPPPSNLTKLSAYQQIPTRSPRKKASDYGSLPEIKSNNPYGSIPTGPHGQYDLIKTSNNNMNLS